MLLCSMKGCKHVNMVWYCSVPHLSHQYPASVDVGETMTAGGKVWDVWKLVCMVDPSIQNTSSRSEGLEDCSLCPTQTGTSFMVSIAGVVYPGSQLPFSLACCQSLMHCASWASVNDSFWVCPLHVLLHLSCVPIRSILMWSCYGLTTSSSRKKFTWLSKFLASPISPIFWVSYIKPLVSTGEAQRHK